MYYYSIFSAYIVNKETSDRECADFPLSEDNRINLFKRIGLDEASENYEMADYNLPGNLDSCAEFIADARIDKLNELADEIGYCDEWYGLKILFALISEGYSLEDSLYKIRWGKANPLGETEGGESLEHALGRLFEDGFEEGVYNSLDDYGVKIKEDNANSVYFIYANELYEVC